MRGFTRDKILFFGSIAAILVLIGLSMFSARHEANADNAKDADTLVVSAVTCENGLQLNFAIDEKVSGDNLVIDGKYICLTDSSGAVIPVDAEHPEVSAEGAIIIRFKNKVGVERLKKSVLSLKKGFKVSRNGKSLSCDIDWAVSYDSDFGGSLRYEPKADFKYGGASEITLYVGEARKLNFTCNPDPKCFGGKWYSSRKKVLTVEDGVVTAVSVGTAKISCSFAYEGRAFVTVEVKKGEIRQSGDESSGESETIGTEESASESISASVSESECGESENISETHSEKESIPESESLNESESEIESESVSESETVSGSESVSESETVSESESATESESVTESESERQSECESEGDSEFVSESERESEYESEFESESVNEGGSETQSESIGEFESEDETASDKEAEQEVETASDREAEPEAETASDGESEHAESDGDGRKTSERSETESGEKESDKVSESGETDESKKSSERGGMSGRTTSNTTSGSAGGNDNDGETGKDGTEKKGKSIVFPIICSGALIALGILTATGKKNHRK